MAGFADRIGALKQKAEAGKQEKEKAAQEQAKAEQKTTLETRLVSLQENFKNAEAEVAEAMNALTELDSMSPEDLSALGPDDLAEVNAVKTESGEIITKFNQLKEEIAAVTAELAVFGGGEATVASTVESSVEAPVETAVEAPVEAAVEAPVETTVEVPVETDVEAPAEAAVEAPVEVVAEAPVEAAVEAPVDAATEAETAKLKKEDQEFKERNREGVESLRDNMDSKAEEKRIELRLWHEHNKKLEQDPAKAMEAPVEAAVEAPVDAAAEAEAAKLKQEDKEFTEKNRETTESLRDKMEAKQEAERIKELGGNLDIQIYNAMYNSELPDANSKEFFNYRDSGKFSGPKEVNYSARTKEQFDANDKYDKLTEEVKKSDVLIVSKSQNLENQKKGIRGIINFFRPGKMEAMKKDIEGLKTDRLAKAKELKANWSTMEQHYSMPQWIGSNIRENQKALEELDIDQYVEQKMRNLDNMIADLQKIKAGGSHKFADLPSSKIDEALEQLQKKKEKELEKVAGLKARRDNVLMKPVIINGQVISSVEDQLQAKEAEAAQYREIAVINHNKANKQQEEMKKLVGLNVYIGSS